MFLLQRWEEYWAAATQGNQLGQSAEPSVAGVEEGLPKQTLTLRHVALEGAGGSEEGASPARPQPLTHNDHLEFVRTHLENCVQLFEFLCCN